MITISPFFPCLTEEQLTKTESFKHQADIIEVTKDKHFFGLFMEQGTGKTHVTIATFTHLFRAGKLNGVLILAPNGVHDNWVRNEIPKHCALEPGQYEIACWHSSDGARRRQAWQYVAALEDQEKLVILAANIEAVRTADFLKTIRPFMENRRFMLVVDESTAVKNPKAEVTKQTIKVARNATYTRILTGTPITQGPLDLWSQCRVLDEFALPYPSYTAFKHEFAVEQIMNMGNRTFTKVVGYKNEDRLAKLIAPFTYRVLKKDCLDLPDKIYQTRYVELTPEQKRIYKDLVKQCLAQLGPGLVTVTTAITMMLRLHQVTLGYVGDDEKNIVPIPHNRIKALGELLEENPEPSIIFVRFVQDIVWVHQFLRDQGRRAVPYYGAVSSSGRHEAVDQFQNGEADYFVATNAAAKGLTLTRAQHVIYYSQGFSLETRLQSEDRAHRIGQKNNVLYTDLVSVGTVDERIIEALHRKHDLAKSVLDRAQIEELLQLEE